MTSRRVATVGVVMLAVSVVGCGQQRASSTFSQAEVASAGADLRAVAAAINGTLDENVASEQLIYAAVQGSIQSCMASKGLRYQPPPFVNMYEGWSGMPIGSDSAALRDVSVVPSALNGLGVVRERLISLRAEADTPNPGFDELKTQAERDEYAAASASCVPSTDSVVAAGNPRPDHELQAAWVDLLAQVDLYPEVAAGLASYPDCMAAQGFSAERIEDVRASLLDELQDPERRASQPSEANWSALVARENAAARADSTCRSAVHDVALVAASSDVAAFREKFADRLAQRSAAWAAIEAEAVNKVAELRALDPSMAPD